MNFKVTDTRNNVLNDQRFIITVRGKIINKQKYKNLIRQEKT